MHANVGTCAELILKMVDWRADNALGEFVDESSPNDESKIVSIPDAEIGRIEGMGPRADEVAEFGEDPEEPADTWLGRYHPLSSPGLIKLHWERIGSFFWHHIAKLLFDSHKVSAYELCRLAEAAVAKTLVHEEFHHHADVLRILFKSSYDRLREEALAVASSYLSIVRTGGCTPRNWKRARKPLRTDFIEAAYRYSAKGYRDWVNYRSRSKYEDGVLDYLVPSVALGLLERATIERHIRDCFLKPIIRRAFGLRNEGLECLTNLTIEPDPSATSFGKGPPAPSPGTHAQLAANASCAMQLRVSLNEVRNLRRALKESKGHNLEIIVMTGSGTHHPIEEMLRVFLRSKRDTIAWIELEEGLEKYGIDLD